jgi:hypothetical protein
LRIAAIISAVAALSLVAVGVGFAQGTPPTITVTASETTLSLSAPGPFAAGQTRFNVVQTDDEELEILIAALREGVTVDEFTAALRSNPDASLELVHLDAGVSLTGRDSSRAVTFNLRPNTTYVVGNITGERPADWEITSFSVTGAANGARAPQADANVRIIDLRFRGDKVLPRNGVVRFAHNGWAPHFAFAMPLRKGAKQRDVGRALLRNRERQLNRLVNFERAVEAQSLITRGAVNYNEINFRRRGRYVMACFFDGHNTQGMYRFIRVR